MRLLLCMLLALTASIARADNWPAWRGPGGQGHTSETNLPLHWSPKQNVKWKTPLTHRGNSTPIVWGDKLFLTQADKGGNVRSLLCFDRADGKLLWKKDVDYPEKERVWGGETYCNASPVTDGERVVVSFASAGLYCYDFKGNELWKRTDLGKYEHVYGNSSSPILHGDLAILWTGPNEGGKGRNDLLAVKKTTGETVWEHKEKSGSWGTPLVVNADGKDQILLGMTGKLKSFDPKTGEVLWTCDGLSNLVYTSALFHKNVAVSMSGYGGAALAVKVGGKGDITKERLWHHPKNIQRVGSGSIVGDHIYILEENGLPHCYELETGKEVWQVQKRPGGNSWSSMLVSGDRLYVTCQNGDTHVFAANPKYELLATNPLGESTNASIAVSNGELFLRTQRHLWCISERK